MHGFADLSLTYSVRRLMDPQLYEQVYVLPGSLELWGGKPHSKGIALSLYGRGRSI